MDITQATRLARSMVCEWGMSDLGTIAFDERDREWLSWNAECLF